MIMISLHLGSSDLEGKKESTLEEHLNLSVPHDFEERLKILIFEVFEAIKNVKHLLFLMKQEQPSPPLYLSKSMSNV